LSAYVVNKVNQETQLVGHIEVYDVKTESEVEKMRRTTT